MVIWPGEGAYAAEEMRLGDLQREVVAAREAYEKTLSEVDKAQKQVADATEQIKTIEDELAHQRDKSDNAMRALYKLHNDSMGIAEILLGSSSLTDVISTNQYLNIIDDRANREIKRYSDLKSDLEATKAELAVAQQTAEQRSKDAAVALDEAKQAREHEQEKTSAIATRDAGARVHVDMKFDEIDWDLPEEEFVDAWARRLDAYLAGSPLANQGKTFAQAAWDYGVDPRWSAAISTMESSKGRLVPYGNSHNAWGLTSGADGFARFSSWEEAIDKHTKYLASTYGYTITLAGAKKYCPPNYEKWFDTIVHEMLEI